MRKDGTLGYRGRRQSQVTVEYDGDVPVRVEALVISTQHSADVALLEQLRADIRREVMNALLPAGLRTSTKYYINPTGRLWWAGRRAIPASRAARLSWILTAAWAATAAAPSPAPY